MGLLKTIFILGIIYYGLKLIGRYLFPFLIRVFIRKQQEKYASTAGSNTSTSKNYSTPPKKKREDKLGEYVDYEEVD